MGCYFVVIFGASGSILTSSLVHFVLLQDVCGFFSGFGLFDSAAFFSVLFKFQQTAPPLSATLFAFSSSLEVSYSDSLASFSDVSFVTFNESLASSASD